MGVYISIQDPDFISFGCIPRSGIAESYGSSIFFLIYFLFLAALGLCCCMQAFSSCGEQGLLFVAVCGLLIVVAPLVVELRL